jgi:hypothetical protein
MHTHLRSFIKRVGYLLKMPVVTLMRALMVLTMVEWLLVLIGLTLCHI